MPTFKVKMRVRGGNGEVRDIITNFAGCRDEMDARAKARAIYSIELVHWVRLDETVKEKWTEVPVLKKDAGPEM